MTLFKQIDDLQRPLEWRASPSAALEPYVACYRGLMMPPSLPLNFSQRSSPSGNVIMYFAFGKGQIYETVNLLQRNEEIRQRPNQAIILPKNELWGVSLEKATDVILVMFKSGMAAPFLNLSISELVHWVDPENIWSRSNFEQLMQLGFAPPPARVQLIEKILLSQLAKARIVVDDTVQHALRIIENGKGNIDLKLLADHLNVSGRHLRRQFQHHVG
ncbi:MAG: DUF6597 domain-containing transcriptional factor, partial [Chloroflexota bacterium]